MNQGIKIIDKNSWVLFLGSDDKFMNNHVLENINFEFNKLDLKNINLLIFKVRYFDIRTNNFTRGAYFINNKIHSFLNIGDYKKLIFKGYAPPHQSTLFNGKSKTLYEGYNDNYKIAADLEFFCRIAKYKKLSIANFPVDIINISTGGISDKNTY